MAGQDPEYPFAEPSIALRRYFKANSSISGNSRVDMPMPYIHMKLRWIYWEEDDDVVEVSRTPNPRYDEWYSGMSSFGIRVDGTVVFRRFLHGQSEPDWEQLKPSQPQTTRTTKLVSMKTGTLEIGKGSEEDLENMKCPSTFSRFEILPDVAQFRAPQYAGHDPKFGIQAYDCSLLAEVEVIAGIYKASNCIVDSFGNTASTASVQQQSTCYVDSTSVERRLESHWLSELALDFTSEVLKYSTLLGYTQPSLSDDLDRYVTGALTVGYHAAWSGLMARWGNTHEQITVRQAEPIVRASVDKGKVDGWLGLNLALTVSALLVLVAGQFVSTKMLSDTTLAALTIDLSGLVHQGRAKGLCHAVSINKQYRELPALVWSSRPTISLEEQKHTRCNRRVQFVDDDEQVLVNTDV